jgi:hypothetical protein
VKKNPVINLKEKNVLKIAEKNPNKRHWKENSTEHPVESMNR